MPLELYKLNKTVLSIQNNAAQFLSGLTSNTFDKSKNAFLSVHGRIVATFDQIRVADDHFLIVLERPFLDGVFTHVERFVKLSRVSITTEDDRVYFDLEGSYQATQGEFVIPQRKGRLVITPQDLAPTVSDEEFTLFRLKHNIPIHGVDYNDEMILNVNDDEYVSYTKGCFLGQEPVAKVHNRSKPTWKLVVKYEDDHSVEQRQEMTSRMIDPETKKVFDFVTSDRQISAQEIADTYKRRWAVELLFRWFKGHLNIRYLPAKKPNSVKTQLAIAVLLQLLLQLKKITTKYQGTLWQLLRKIRTTLQREGLTGIDVPPDCRWKSSAQKDFSHASV